MTLNKIKEYLEELDNCDSPLTEYSIGEKAILRTEPKYDDEGNDTPDWKKLPILFEAEIVGGSYFEDHGDGMTIDIVFKVEDKFYQIDGYYSSWEGTDWQTSDVYEVFPREVTITEYTRSKK